MRDSGLAALEIRRLESPPAMQTAPAVTPAVATPTTAPARTPAATVPAAAATAQSSPPITPAASPPLHVLQIIKAGSSSRRKREDRCRLGSYGPGRKNKAC